MKQSHISIDSVSVCPSVTHTRFIQKPLNPLSRNLVGTVVYESLYIENLPLLVKPFCVELKRGSQYIQKGVSHFRICGVSNKRAQIVLFETCSIFDIA